MKLLIKLLIAVLLANACYRAGTAAWRYYQFKDAVQEEARFGGKETPATLHTRMLAIAAAQDVPIEPSDLVVQKDGTSTTVSAAYLEYIELVPSLYTREHLFEFEVNVPAYAVDRVR